MPHYDNETLIKRFLLLYNMRTDAFNTQTCDLFTAIEPAVNGLNQFFISTGIFSDTTIEWVNITHDEIAPDADAIIMLGVLSYLPGAVVTLTDGEQVTVTEDTAVLFNKPITITLPLDIVVCDSSQQVIDYLTERTERETSTVNKSDNTTTELSTQDMKRILLTAKNPEGVFH